jgi:hypothetical protein
MSTTTVAYILLQREIIMAERKIAAAAPAPITVEQIEAAERAKIVAHALNLQRHRQQVEAAAAKPLSEKTARVLRAFDRMEQRKYGTPDQRLNAQAERQRQESMARSTANGYREWEPALDEYGRARLREIQAEKRREV